MTTTHTTELLPVAKFPSVIDSTIISSFSDCPLKCYREYFLGLSSDKPSVHLHAGGAFARAIEAVRRFYYEDGLPVAECLEQGFIAYTRYWGDYESPEGSPKSFERMWRAVEYYFQEYPLDSDPIQPYRMEGGKLGIEFSFAIPLPVENPDTADPITFAGRADMLGYYNNLIAIIDEKTASALGASWANQWKLRGQFLGYTWAAKQFGIPVSASIIRGVGILKTKFTTVEVFQQYPDHLVNRWYTSMLSKVIMMTEYYKASQEHGEKVFPMSFSTACTNYGGCFFSDLCQSREPEAWYGDFAVRHWNPLHMNPTDSERK